MRRYDVITEICDAMIALGWKPYQNDHEDANGQFEMNWEYDTALRTADRHAFFKYMVKSIAEKHGLRATFMPKPFLQPHRQRLPRARLAVVARTARTCSRTRRASSACRKTAYHFIGGAHAFGRGAVRDHQPDGELLQAHQRAARPLSGATWSPNTVTYARQQPHAHDPHPRRRPLRAAPRRRRRQSLSAAGGACWRRGSTASSNKRDPGKRLDINMYTEGHTAKDAKKLPLNLLDALRALDRSSVLQERPGRGRRRLLPQAQARRLERVRRAT